MQPVSVLALPLGGRKLRGKQPVQIDMPLISHIASLRTIQQGSEKDQGSGARPLLALAGAFQMHSCTCNETTTKSGQARRGFDRALGVMAGFPRGEKKPPEGGCVAAICGAASDYMWSCQSVYVEL